MNRYLMKGALLAAAMSLVGVCSTAHAARVSTLIDTGIGFNDDVAFDADGNLYISNAGSFVDGALSGTKIFQFNVDEELSDFVTGAMGPTGIGVDNSGVLYYTNSGNDQLIRVLDDTSENIASPAGNIEFNAEGVGFFASYNQSTIYRLNLDLSVDVLSQGGDLNGPVGLALDEEGNLYAANFNDGKILRINSDGSTTELDGGSYGGVGYLAYAGGDLYATAFGQHVVYKLTLEGETEIIAGQLNETGHDNGEGEDARFTRPNGITPTLDGSALIVSEYGGSLIRKIELDLDPKVTTMLDTGLGFNDDLAWDSAGNLYISNPGPFVDGGLSGTVVFQYETDETLSEIVTDAMGPTGIGIDEGDALYYTNSGTDELVKVDSGNAEVVASPGGNIEFNSQGVGFIASYNDSTIYQLNTDGSTEVFAEGGNLNGPVGLAIDESDNIFVANFNDGAIMVFGADGDSVVIDEGEFGGVGYLTYLNGQLYATAFGQHIVYKLSLMGETEIIAGQLGVTGADNGYGVDASFTRPNGIIPTSDRKALIVSEYGSSLIRKIMLNDRISFAVDDHYTTEEDQVISFNPLENDEGFGDDIDVSSLDLVFDPITGSLVHDMDTGEIIYTPATNYNGDDCFTYLVSDLDNRLSNNAKVCITMTPVNDVPVGGDDAFSVPQGQELSIPVLRNDNDPDQRLGASNISIVSQAGSGSLSVSDVGSIVYAPNDDFVGTDTFTYQLTDDEGAMSDIVNVSIEVQATNAGDDDGGGSLGYLTLSLAMLGLLARQRKRKRA
jgi:sugar lactone lactonase YvrE